ncbi:MAG: VWA domain-containing protein, partial [Acidobacteriota bacterium]
MFRKISPTIYIIIFSSLAFAQSGRVKPSETPAPTPRPHIVYLPTQNKSENPKPNVLPTLPTKLEDEGDIISVDSTLVPIPVSVIDQNGQAVTNLKLENFDLQIDGKAAEIGELSRSDSPVRLALLFDNSSSVTIAREFEKKAAIRFFKKVLRPDEDLAALYSVQTGTRLEQPLTKNVSQLTDAIENFPVPAGATALLDAIITAADYLKTVQGRRVIVIVSDGEDTISDATFEDTVKA